MTLAELRKRHDDLLAESHALVDGVDVLDDETRSKLDDLKEQRASILATIEARKALEDEKRASRAPATAADPADINPPAADPEVRTGADREADRPFASLGEQLRAVAATHERSDVMDPRLKRLLHEERTQTGNVAGDGGFLVDQPLADGIISRAIEEGPLWSRVRRIPLSGNSNGVRLKKIKTDDLDHGTAYGGVQAYWRAAGGAITASDLEFETSELRLKSIAALVYAEEELLSDAPALDATINSEVPTALRYKVEDALVNGTGNGMPLGIRQVAANIEVAKDSGQTASTYTAGNAANQWGRMIPASRANAIWLMDHTVVPFVMQMKIGDTPVWQPNFQQSPDGTLLGRPIFVSEHLPTVGTADDCILIDPTQYAFIEKALRSAASMHVRFIYNEMAFRFDYRCDGQPLFRNPLTTRNDSTLSPFVSVAVRS